jgi:hypothetical protein
MSDGANFPVHELRAQFPALAERVIAGSCCGLGRAQ